MSKTWASPDGKIHKTVVTPGDSSIYKPTEGTECTVKITNCPVELIHCSKLVIGESHTDLGRILDVCVSTMYKKEVADFCVFLGSAETCFSVTLEDYQFGGFLYEWDVEKKKKYAMKRKEMGIELFKQGFNREAAFHFNKALKVICSVPLDAELSPQEHEFDVKELEVIKAKLYSNLASCFLKKNEWLLVIDFCNKALAYDPEDVKTCYKIAVAHMHDKNFEKADVYFKKVLVVEPNNKAAIDHHKFVLDKLRQSQIKCDNMIKKMFADTFK